MHQSRLTILLFHQHFGLYLLTKLYKMKQYFLLLILPIFSLFPFYSVSQCPGGQVMVDVAVETDSWGYESFWELTPAGNGCGNGTLFSFGNVAQIGCAGAGAQTATGGNGYGNNITTYETLGCLTIGDCFDINFVDDWGDGGSTFTVTIMGIDQGPFVGSGTGNVFNFCVTVPFINNVDIATVEYEYTKIPLSQVGNIIQDGIISSLGAGNVTGATMNVEVFKDVTSVYNMTSTPQNINAGTSATFSTSAYTPTLTGIYTITYTSDINETDEDLTDNSISFILEVTDSVFARDNGINDIGGVGIGGGLEGHMGNVFEITNSQFLTSISALIDNSTSNITGKNFELEVFALNGSGTPTTLLATTESKTVNGINEWYDLKLIPSLSLAPGNYLLAINQDTSYQQQIGASSSISTNGTCWVSWTNQPWTVSETFGFDIALMIRANLNAVAELKDNTSELLKVYPNPAKNELTVSNLAIGSHIEIINSLGQIVMTLETLHSATSIDITTLKSGFYTLKSSSNQEIRNSKFVKN